MVLSALGFCPLTCLAIPFDVDVESQIWIFPIACIAVIVSAGGYLKRNGSTKKAEIQTRARLYEEYATVGGWIVELTVFQGAAPTGWDQGGVWFDDDRLMFSGARTSFALAASGVRELLEPAWAVSDLVSDVSILLEDRTSAGQVSVGLRVVPSPRAVQLTAQGVGALRAAVRGWLAASPVAEGGGPPVALGPGVPSTGRLLWAAIQNTGIWVAIGAGLVTIGVAQGAATAAFASVLAAAVLLTLPNLWVPRLRWRAYRDRRRLRRDS